MSKRKLIGLKASLSTFSTYASMSMKYWTKPTISTSNVTISIGCNTSSRWATKFGYICRRSVSLEPTGSFTHSYMDLTPSLSAKAAPLLVGFTDSDWVGDSDDRKSTASYVFTPGSRPITWACKKQAAISLSSAEAEYRGAVEASKEALWLRQILSEFGFEQQHPTTLWCDNQSAIQLCKDPVQHQRSKHIELHMHFIRNLIHDHVLEAQYCSTDDQVADIFTKALTEAKFTKLRCMLGVQEVVTKGG
eukprot:PITA_14603